MVGSVAAGAPLLVVPSLRGADGVDGTTVSPPLQGRAQEEKRRKTVKILQCSSLARCGRARRCATTGAGDGPDYAENREYHSFSF